MKPSKLLKKKTPVARKPRATQRARGETVLDTPWFQVVSEPAHDSDAPFYIINAPNFAVTVAVDTEGRLILVRQYRQAVATDTLELPAGHIEHGETPEETARKELLEETGYEGDKFELLVTLSPSTARFTNRLYCFYAANVRRVPGAEIERGMNPVLYTRGVRALLREPNFLSAGNYAALFAAVAAGKVRL